jgi:hypothetical protein
VSCRRPACLAALAAVLIVAARPAPVRAAAVVSQATNGTASYELVNSNPPGTAPVTKIVANVIPPGTIQPPDPSTSPLTILPGSSGFDENNLQVLLGSGQTPSGSPLQALALNFGSQGFAPGGVLNFSLSLSNAFTGAPTLQLPDSSTGLAITQLTTPPSNNQPATGGTSSNNTSTGGTVPEPVSLALWSTAALAFVAVRVHRARAAASRS